MLQEFLIDSAAALKATGQKDAVDVADMLAEIKVPQNWQSTPDLEVLEQLPASLAAENCHPAAAALSRIYNHLNWQEAPRKMPASFVGRYCFTILVGPEGLIKHDRFNFGTFFQGRHTFYPSHRHKAVEIYFPFSGTALWQHGEDEFAPVKPGTLIHHPSCLPHATETLDEPLLAIWAWTGDLAFDSYEISSD